MSNKKTRLIWKWTRIAIIVYLVIGAVLYFIQDKFIWHPKTLPGDYKFSFKVPFRQVDLEVSKNRMLSIVQFTVADSFSKGVVLYFHGNRQNIERYAPFANHFTRNNYEVWMVDYPGFGKSTGDRTERQLYEDASTLYKMARSRVSKDSIIIYGKSIGTGIASWLAGAKDCRRLILETPYFSMHSLMRQYAFIYPVSQMSKYKFPTNEHLQKVTAPVTILHGNKDEVIPFSQSRKLMRLAKPGDELVRVEGGRHNNLHEHQTFHHKLDSLLSL